MPSSQTGARTILPRPVRLPRRTGRAFGALGSESWGMARRLLWAMIQLPLEKKLLPAF